MAGRSPVPPGVPWISPYLTVKDAGKAVAFYERAFGFTVKELMRDPNGAVTHAEMTWKTGLIMLGPEGAYGSLTKSPHSSGTTSPVTLYVYCEDVDALSAKATAAGAKELLPPADMFWGDRMCKLIDPDGHIWNFACNVADFDPSKIP